ncbi:MAG TPA: SagB/ThcOx family dehydrogenase [Patescibacteria group bacterium]|nr:SagB/ThcOx family dehydrogenase [Patescibacteria group bacterium]
MKNDKTINILKKLELSSSIKFNNSIKIKNFSKTKTSYSAWPEQWKKVYYKAYPKFPQVLLPDPARARWSLDDALIKRKSQREFTKKDIKIQDLSTLLYFSSGLKELLFKGSGERRFYPSAGARYPLEIYPVIFNAESIKPAIYHYHVKSHSLEEIYSNSFVAQIIKQFNQPWIRKSSMLIVVSAVFERTDNKYGDRGLRHIFTEYGHYAQNIYLISQELGLGSCSIGGFIDDGLNKLLDFDPIDESVIGVIAIGTL